MSYQVFVSHSSRDAEKAQAIRQALENEGISCWIAPRDILPGKDYAESIIEAIQTCPLFLLVLSKASNASGQVRREVERAASKNVPIMPVRVDATQPNDLHKTMEYFIATHHWLDASGGAIDAHLPEIRDKVKRFLASGSEHAEPTPPTAPWSARPVPSPAPSSATPEPTSPGTFKKLPRALGILAALAVLAAAIATVPWLDLDRNQMFTAPEPSNAKVRMDNTTKPAPGSSADSATPAESSTAHAPLDPPAARTPADSVTGHVPASSSDAATPPQPLATTHVTVAPPGPAIQPGNDTPSQALWNELAALAEKPTEDITLSLNRDSFAVGEDMVITSQIHRDGYLNVLSMTEGDDSVTVLFPNAYHRDNRVRAGQSVVIPAEGDGFALTAQPPAGKTLVVVFLTQQAINANLGEKVTTISDLFAVMAPPATRGFLVRAQRNVNTLASAKVETTITERNNTEKE